MENVTVRLKDNLPSDRAVWVKSITDEAKGYAELTPKESPDGVGGRYLLCDKGRIRPLVEVRREQDEDGMAVYSVNEAPKKYFTVSKKILKKFKQLNKPKGV